MRVRSPGTDVRLRLIINDSSPLGWWSESTRTLPSVKSRPTVTPAALSHSNRRGKAGGWGGGHPVPDGCANGPHMGVRQNASFTTSQTNGGRVCLFVCFVAAMISETLYIRRICSSDERESFQNQFLSKTFSVWTVGDTL